jgi:uncharacterized protein (TIGR03435 family)
MPDLPNWAKSEFYDIDVKETGLPNAEVMQNMWVSVLDDRFKLKSHRETRQLPAYVLTTLPDGFKGAVRGNCTPDQSNIPFTPNTVPCGRIFPVLNLANSRLQGGRLRMGDLTKGLADDLGEPVIDQTGVSTLFDAVLPFNSTATARVESLTQSLADRLGLKLEKGTGSVEVMVLENIERPAVTDRAPAPPQL